MLRLRDDWVWDSWVADDGRRFHLFFLKAPRALGDPELRHTAARIGHATSLDLLAWTVHDDVLAPAAAGWDDLAIWTGSVVQGDDGTWRLFYSALSTVPGHGIRDQRIGVAVSEDLFVWRRVGEQPLLAPDGRWYRTLEDDPAASDAWRDPFVFRCPGGGGWQMLICAAAEGAAGSGAGVLARAHSKDLAQWVLGPPATTPAGFGELEVPQVRIVDGQAVLVFTCAPARQSRERVARFGDFNSWYVLGDSPDGPWDLAVARPFVDVPELFAGQLVQQRDGHWVLLGFLNVSPETVGAFEVIDPVAVALRGGELRRA